jgi:cation transport regulator ChaC
VRTATVALLAAGLGLQGAVLSSGFQLHHGGRHLPTPNQQQSQNQSPITVVGNSPAAEIPDQMEREQHAKYIAQRHAQATEDARRLSQLARELEAELDQADGLTLPATSIKKTDEIVKLAKSVKSKMRAY